MVDMGEWRKDRVKRGMTACNGKSAERRKQNQKKRLIRLQLEDTNTLLQQASQGIGRMKRMIRIDMDKKREVRLPYQEINESFEQVGQAVRKMRRMIRVESRKEVH